MRRICRRVPQVDLPRAERIAAGLPSPTERAYGWTFVADGLVAKDRTGALAALEKALHEIESTASKDSLSEVRLEPGRLDSANGGTDRPRPCC